MNSELLELSKGTKKVEVQTKIANWHIDKAWENHP